jgi:uncharacterized protein with LGFP repeats
LRANEHADCGWAAGTSVVPNDQVHVNTGVDSEVGDLLNDAGGAVDVNDSLVNAHLEAVVGVGTITAGGTTSGDGQHLGGDADDATGLVALLFGPGDDFGAGVLKGLDFPTTEGHSDSLDCLLNLFFVSLILFGVHFR